jgi:hypothetical protein
MQHQPRSAAHLLLLMPLLTGLLLVGCKNKTEQHATPTTTQSATTTPFNGTIKDSIRDSKPDFRMDHNAPAAAPNIVVIIADDLGFSDLGSYGSEIHTPNIDRIAQNGLRYNNFTATAMCSPLVKCHLPVASVA